MQEKNEQNNTIVGSINVTLPSLEADIVATLTSPEGDEKKLIFDDTTPSGTIVQDSTHYVGADLQPDYYEVLTENVERSRGLLEGGLKLSFTLPEALGGFSFEFERKPKSETKTIKKAIFRK